MSHIVVYDTEYLAVEGANKRSWKGMDDPYPLVVQIAAVRISIPPQGSPLAPASSHEFSVIVKPRDEYGNEIPLDPYFINLTGISQEDVDLKSVELSDALYSFSQFVGDCPIYSYGRDHLTTLLPSCYIAGIKFLFPPQRFRDIRRVFRRAGVTEDVIYGNSSGTIARVLGAHFEGRVHDAMDDVRSIVAALGLLCQRGSLKSEWLLER